MVHLWHSLVEDIADIFFAFQFIVVNHIFHHFWHLGRGLSQFGYLLSIMDLSSLEIELKRIFHFTVICSNINRPIIEGYLEI